MRWKGEKKGIVWFGRELCIFLNVHPKQFVMTTNSKVKHTEKEMIHNSCEEDIDAVATRGNVCGGKKENKWTAVDNDGIASERRIGWLEYKKIVNDNNCWVSTQTAYLPKLEKEAKKLAATQKGRSKGEEECLSVIDLK